MALRAPIIPIEIRTCDDMHATTITMNAVHFTSAADICNRDIDDAFTDATHHVRNDYDNQDAQSINDDFEEPVRLPFSLSSESARLFSTFLGVLS